MLGRLEHPREAVGSAGGGNETGAPGGRLGEDTSTTSSTFHGSVTDHGRARREAGLETSVIAVRTRLVAAPIFVISRPRAPELATTISLLVLLCFSQFLLLWTLAFDAKGTIPFSTRTDKFTKLALLSHQTGRTRITLEGRELGANGLWWGDLGWSLEGTVCVSDGW